MKKLLTLVAVVGFFTAAHAQIPASGDKQFTFGLTGGGAPMGVAAFGPTGTLQFKYFLADDMAARASLVFANTTTTGVALNGGGKKVTTVTKASAMGLSIGAQKTLTSTDNMMVYLAADLGYMSGGGSTKVTTDGGDPGDGEAVLGTTTTLSLIPALGFNYFFTKNLALGAEFGYGFASASTGEGEFRPATGATVKSGTTSKTSGLTPAGTGMITFSVGF